MPMRLNVGASKKIGEANYGSRGASVNLELELDATLVLEPAKLQEKIRQLFGLVRTALTEELNNGNNGHTTPSTPHDPTASMPPPQPTNGNGTAPRSGSVRRSTPAQIKALYAIAREQGLDLRAWLRDRCQVERPDDLNIRQASTLIENLKSSGNQPDH